MSWIVALGSGITIPTQPIGIWQRRWPLLWLLVWEVGAPSMMWRTPGAPYSDFMARRMNKYNFFLLNKNKFWTPQSCDYLRCELIKMEGMPSHFIPPLQEEHYPSSEETYYYHLNHAIHDYYYNNFLQRLCANRSDGCFIDWYHNQYNSPFPLTFVLDNKVGFTLAADQDKQWLVFIHATNAMHMHLVCYLVITGSYVRLFGDGPTGTTLDTNNGVNISGVVIPLNHTINMVEGDMSSL